MLFQVLLQCFKQISLMHPPEGSAICLLFVFNIFFGTKQVNRKHAHFI